MASGHRVLFDPVGFVWVRVVAVLLRVRDFVWWMGDVLLVTDLVEWLRNRP